MSASTLTSRSVANFHSDLLSYLAGSRTATAYDPESRGSIPQLLKGGVQWETLAIYVKTERNSVQKGESQWTLFQGLKQKYPEFRSQIKPYLAIENGSAFCTEDEPLKDGLKRLETWAKDRIIYISLTWNQENRFGGGNETNIGLKDDGKKVLDWMSEHQIAIDLSHTSDRLAEDILDYIDSKKLHLIPIASHSNFRQVADLPRNLPDSIALEIAKRKGLIGLAMVRRFLGTQGIEDLIRHVQHAHQMGVLHCLCFGADFFDDRNYPPNYHLRPMFLPEFEDASCFRKVVGLLEASFEKEVVDAIAYQNLKSFLEKQ